MGDQKCTLEVAKIIREDFLQQNGFSEYDFFCPIAKTIGMMRCIVTYHETAQKVMGESSGDNKITWGMIYAELKDLHVEITDMKFLLPRQDDKVCTDKYGDLNERILAGFRKISFKE